jgi:hypothetical protein
MSITCKVLFALYENTMGRKPIGKKAMTATERSQRRYERQRPDRQLARLTAAFLAAEESARMAFIDWLRKKRFLR